MKSQLNIVENHASACKMTAKTQDEPTQVSVRTPAASLKGTMVDTRVTYRSISQIMMMINLANGSRRKQDGLESATNELSSRAVHGS